MRSKILLRPRGGDAAETDCGILLALPPNVNCGASPRRSVLGFDFLLTAADGAAYSSGTCTIVPEAQTEDFEHQLNS